MDFDYRNLNIVYEDNHLLVVVKPQNVPSQGDESGDKDMLTLLKEYLADKYDKKGNVYLGLVHRLDRPTGGVMVFAKTSKCAERLSESLQNGEMEKKYLAVVQGELPAKNGRLDNYLYKYSTLNIVKVVPPATEGAKRAVLDYKSIAVKDGQSLVQIKLYTGRSHQIRAQMSFIGNPLVGDAKYGAIKSKNPTPLALWAYELRFPHPISKVSMVFRVYPDVEIAPWNAFDVDSLLRITIND
jgi:23S rRNA pseudouridine1911/1915/1917 synthase